MKTANTEYIKKNASWSPQPKQEMALVRPEFEIGFGGARSGGKTEAGIVWLGYDVKHPLFRALVLRKNSTDLIAWIDRADRFFRQEGGIKTGNPPVFTFPKGGKIFTGHLKDKNAYEKYQGHEYARILFEELEHVPSEESYLKILSTCRSVIPELRPQIFSTFNPGGPGHTWIKRRFNLTGIPRKPIITKDKRSGRSRIFIPSRVEDNKFMMDNDPEYVRFLESLPDGLREQWRWGSWDDPDIKGAYYTLELKQARKEGKIGEVPYNKEFPVFLWFDIGNDMTSIGFFQFIGKAVHVINYLQDSNKGLPYYIAKLAELRETYGYKYEKYYFPHDIGNSEWGTGTTRTETLESLNIPYEVVEKISKDDGRHAVRIVFPRIYFDAEKCAELIDALQNYHQQWDEKKIAFIGDDVHDWASHPADMFRYFATSYKDLMGVGKKKAESSEFGELPERMKETPEKEDWEDMPVEQGASRFHHD